MVFLRQVSSVLIAMPLLWLASCDSVTEPERPAVRFTYGVPRLAWEPPFVINETSDSLIIRGFLSTPCQPYDASAIVLREGTALTLRVIGKATRECPRDVATNVGYEASVDIAETPIARLKVVHAWSDVNWPATTLLDTSLSP